MLLIRDSRGNQTPAHILAKRAIELGLITFRPDEPRRPVRPPEQVAASKERRKTYRREWTRAMRATKKEYYLRCAAAATIGEPAPERPKYWALIEPPRT